MEAIDWRTPHEKAKEADDARVAARFKELYLQAPSIRRAIIRLAEEEGKNHEALRHRLIRIGVIVPGSKHGQHSGVKVIL